MKHTLLGITKTFGRSSTRLLLVVAIALSGLSIITPASTSAAGETYRMTNASTIQGNGGSYSNANNLFTTVQSGTTSTRAAIGTLTFTKSDSGAFVSKTVSTQWTSGATIASCQMQLSIRLTGSSGTVTAIPAGNANASTCLDRAGVSKTFTVANTNTTPATKEACEAAGGSWVDPSGSGAYGCASAPENNGGDSGAGTTNEDDPLDTSLCNGADVAIRWLACPVTSLLESIVDAIDNFLHETLATDTAIFSNDGYRGAWEAFRTLALALIVIAGLLIVIGQAAGLQILDAYTIKKALPRLLLAVIFISLSWPLLELLVTFTNDIGKWAAGIIATPFESVKTPGGETLGLVMTNWLAGGAAVGFFALGGAALLSGAWGVIISFLFVGLIAVFIAALVIGIRTLLISVCIILAPLAIAFMILPATDKAFELWRKTLISCLLVYPIIMILLATGKVLSVVSGNPIISILVYFAPYFMIPFAFRLAGGVMGKIAGLANNAERGIFDSQRKKRQENYAKMGRAYKSGEGFKENSRTRLGRGLGSALNRTGIAAGVGKQGNFGFGVRGTEAIGQQRQNIASETMKDPRFAPISEDDNALTALGHIGNGTSKADAVARMQVENGMSSTEAVRAYEAARATGLSGRSASMAAAQQRVLTGTGYSGYTDAKGVQHSAYDQMIETIGEASGGNQTVAGSLAGFANAMAKQKGRHDLAPGGGTAASDAAAAAVGAYTTKGLESDSAIIDKQFDSASVYQLANGKGTAIKDTFAPAYIARLKKGLAAYDASGGTASNADLERALIVKKELEAALPNSSGDNRTAINNALEQMNVEINAVYSKYNPPTPTGTVAPPTQAQVTWQQVTQSASRRARAYERPDPNNMT